MVSASHISGNRITKPSPVSNGFPSRASILRSLECRNHFASAPVVLALGRRGPVVSPCPAALHHSVVDVSGIPLKVDQYAAGFRGFLIISLEGLFEDPDSSVQFTVAAGVAMISFESIKLRVEACVKAISRLPALMSERPFANHLPRCCFVTSPRCCCRSNGRKIRPSDAVFGRTWFAVRTTVHDAVCRASEEYSNFGQKRPPGAVSWR